MNIQNIARYVVALCLGQSLCAVQTVINITNNTDRKMNIDLYAPVDQNPINEMVEPFVGPAWIASIKGMSPRVKGAMRENLAPQEYELSAYPSKDGVMSKNAHKLSIIVEKPQTYNVVITPSGLVLASTGPVLKKHDKLSSRAAKKATLNKQKNSIK